MEGTIIFKFEKKYSITFYFCNTHSDLYNNVNVLI